ncbi:hypothetical protein BAE44_0020435 [Dichanthelium oligosanthes]|uniref:Uncharacterized protein n=1 Tax=Dichanthelium oligosanthes TaxID=888268 RepID=A0A1E5V0K4_9POAL|nr:hypothetical protein BAE44_0020435 [Dichanthelium oligosanthes]
MEWGMSELMRNPAVMKKLQGQIREAFQGKAVVTEGDLQASNLRYLKLVIKEALRLHPPAPLLVAGEHRRVRDGRLTMEKLQLEYGPTDTVVNRIVYPKVYSSTFTVSCLLREKLHHGNWTVAKHHLTSNVIVRFSSRHDARHLHGYAYRWNGEEVSFWNVVSIRPLVPDPNDVHAVERI